MKGGRGRKSQDFIFSSRSGEEKGERVSLTLFSRPRLFYFLMAALCFFFASTLFLYSELMKKEVETDSSVQDVTEKMLRILKIRESLEIQLEKERSENRLNAEQVRKYEKEIEALKSELKSLHEKLDSIGNKNSEEKSLLEAEDHMSANSKELLRLSNNVFTVSLYYDKTAKGSKLSNSLNLIYEQMGFEKGVVYQKSIDKASIFYYSESSKDKAELISQAINNLLSLNIQPKLGRGRGVDDDEKDTLIIVWIN